MTVELVLNLHALPGSFVTHEIEAMNLTSLAKTANRSVVGVLNEFAHLAAAWRATSGNLVDLSVRLAHVPCGPLYKTYVDPSRAVAAAADQWVFGHA